MVSVVAFIDSEFTIRERVHIFASPASSGFTKRISTKHLYIVTTNTRRTWASEVKVVSLSNSSQLQSAEVICEDDVIITRIGMEMWYRPNP